MRSSALAAKATLPRYVRPSKRKDGTTAYFWDLPTWARKSKADADDPLPCPLSNEALGTDLLHAITRGEDLNKDFDDWRSLWRQAQDMTASELQQASLTGPVYGTLDWVVVQFQKDPKYTSTRPKTRRGYDQGLQLVCDYRTRTGRRLGDLPAAKLEEQHVDLLYQDLQWVEEKEGDGNIVRRRRLPTANAAMRAMRRLYNIAGRRKWGGIQPGHNPFTKMGMESVRSVTEVPSRAQYEQIRDRADEMGFPSIALACMLAFELCQREGDVIGTLAWTHYKDGQIHIRQSKTGEPLWVPLWDDEGELFPGLAERLDATPRRGTLIVMRDQRDRRASRAAGQPVYLPYKEDWFRHLFRKIARAAGVPDAIQFRAFRHGGLTEMDDAGATSRELMSTSGHTNVKTLEIYTRRSGRQAANAARKRRALRTERGRLSE